MAGAGVELRFDSTDDEERFVRAYLTDAWPRFEAADHWETGWFWRYAGVAGYDCGPDGGLVRLVFEGDPDGLVDAERDRWASFDGLSGWELRRYGEEGYDSLLAQQRAVKGPVGGEREYLLKPLSARFVLDYYRAFEAGLGMVAPADDRNRGGAGFWAHLHYAAVQAGFDWYDETDACLKGLQNRLKSLAAYRGADAAREEYERLRAAWTDYEADLEAWLDEHPTGEASEP